MKTVHTKLSKILWCVVKDLSKISSGRWMTFRRCVFSFNFKSYTVKGMIFFYNIYFKTVWRKQCSHCLKNTFVVFQILIFINPNPYTHHIWYLRHEKITCRNENYLFSYSTLYCQKLILPSLMFSFFHSFINHFVIPSNRPFSVAMARTIESAWNANGEKLRL